MIFVYLLNVRIEGGPVAALDFVALIALPLVQLVIAVEQADLAQVVRVPLPGVHGVCRQIVAQILLGEEAELFQWRRVGQGQFCQLEKGLAVAPYQFRRSFGDPHVVIKPVKNS